MSMYLGMQIWESLALFQHILSTCFIQDFGWEVTKYKGNSLSNMSVISLKD